MARSVRGTIALVQENRFQLVDRDGTTHLLTLDHRVSLPPSELDNEENYLIKKLYGGGLGAVYIENQARV